MTTKITLETHSWPVLVTYLDQQMDGADPQETTEEIPVHTVRQFYVTSSRSIAFEELPAETVVAPVDTGFVSAPPAA